MEILKFKEFTLRPLKLSDAKPYFETMQDKETKKNLNSVPKTLTEAKKEIKRFLKQVKEKGSKYYTIEIKKKFAGNVILQHQNWDPNSGEGRIHLWLHPKYRNKGIATKALKKLINYAFKNGFNKIFAQCKANNKKIMKINKKLGFKKFKTFTNEFGIKKVLWIIKTTDICYKCNSSSNLILKKYLYWTAILSKSLTPIGWIYIVLGRHIEQFEELNNTELIELKKIITELKQMLKKAFNPDWFNVMQLGNSGRHLHFHLIPRYKNNIKFAGKVFSDPDYGKMIIDRFKSADKTLLLKLRNYLKKHLKKT